MKPSDARRFWSRVDRRGEDDCWEWTGSRNSHGYGSFSIGNRAQKAHRLAWEMKHGPIPVGLVIDHLCRVRHCVNPAHMELVTNRENVLRGEGPTARHRRKTHCRHGHEFTSENTIIRKRPSGGRDCRACQDEHNRRRRKGSLAAATPPADTNAAVTQSESRADVACARCGSRPSVETRSLRYGDPWCNVCWDRPLTPPAEKEGTFERSLLRADIKAGNAEAAEAQLQRIKRLEAEAPPAEEEVVAAASVLGLSREETDELVRLARSEGIRTQPAEKEGTP